jgi:hypothetical protein
MGAVTRCPDPPAGDCAGSTHRIQDFKKVEMIDFARTQSGKADRNAGSSNLSDRARLPIMSTKHSTPSRLFLRFWEWSKSQIVQTVPDEMSVCEFDCRRPQCTIAHWESCDYRSHEAAGWLMPDQSLPVLKP